MVKLREENDPDTIANVKCRIINISNFSAETLTIPDDLIIGNILPRLPVKTLIRFTSVSKFWLSTISTPEFAKSHLKFSLNQILLIDKRPLRFMILPYDDEESDSLENPIELENFFDSSFQQKLSKNDVSFVGSGNGLVCFECDHLCFFFICNPALHSYRKIMYPNPGYCSNTSWFGYIPSIDDYRIVVLFGLSRLRVQREPPVYFYVFSLKTGNWKRICDLDDYFTRYEWLCWDTKVVNDILYWSVGFLEYAMPKRIVGYNLVSEQVEVFPWMDWLQQLKVFPGMNLLQQCVSTRFFLRNGCLSIACISLIDRMTEVWTLKQFYDWNSWEKVGSFNRPCTFGCHVTPTGKFLVEKCFELQTPNRFMIVDASLDTEKQRQSHTCSCDNKITVSNAVGYVESLISPFGTIMSIDEEDREL
ncbi:putative F-box protein At1g32420 [Chenopodium quinoa]|uniref:putative F-box protein At1g32420 n=1 Tax=Chenopodium quinoa TaxID=63459 RepID=UPI000B791091|nr:putative F-box protein At1g32420 [Chenopodium quinoa]XP_021748993.1 putative F-box protein At1g32420 [Chenopodium quinoa]